MSIIHTINTPLEHKIKEKGSLFIALAFPLESESEAVSILQDVKKKYYDATHHCYAYRLIDGKFRYSDAGEPNGTAGIRIYNAIEHFELSGVMIIVVRYFGGTKLGVGPLGKAYYDSAFNVLTSSSIVHKKGYRRVEIATDFAFMSHVYRILSGYDVKKIDTSYEDNVIISCYAEESVITAIDADLIEASGGAVNIKQSTDTVFLV